MNSWVRILLIGAIVFQALHVSPTAHAVGANRDSLSLFCTPASAAVSPELRRAEAELAALFDRGGEPETTGHETCTLCLVASACTLPPAPDAALSHPITAGVAPPAPVVRIAVKRQRPAIEATGPPPLI